MSLCCLLRAGAVEEICTEVYNFKCSKLIVVIENKYRMAVI